MNKPGHGQWSASFHQKQGAYIHFTIYTARGSAQGYVHESIADCGSGMLADMANDLAHAQYYGNTRMRETIQ